MKYHYQVTTYDNKHYVLRFMNFEDHQKDIMVKYVRGQIENGCEIEIVRWNEKGERA